jgi:hypothetical protein
MPVRIRLARYGHRNLPFYRIYVADGKAPRDGRHIEIIGHYDPKPGASAFLFPFHTQSPHSDGRRRPIGGPFPIPLTSHLPPHHRPLHRD